MQKDARLKILLVVFLLVFLITLYGIIKYITFDTTDNFSMIVPENEVELSESEKALIFGSDQSAPEGSFVVFTGTIVRLEDASITVQASEYNEIVPNRDPELEDEVISMNDTMTARITEETGYVGITYEELYVGALVSLSVVQTGEGEGEGEDSNVYEAKIIERYGE